MEFQFRKKGTFLRIFEKLLNEHIHECWGGNGDSDLPIRVFFRRSLSLSKSISQWYFTTFQFSPTTQLLVKIWTEWTSSNLTFFCDFDSSEWSFSIYWITKVKMLPNDGPLQVTRIIAKLDYFGRLKWNWVLCLCVNRPQCCCCVINEIKRRLLDSLAISTA